MKSASKIITLALTCFAISASTYAQSPREQFQQMVEQLQKRPGDNTLRETIIKLGAEIKPAPTIPEEARRSFVEGVTIVKLAKEPGFQKLAIASFDEALKIAPWWSDAYYNLAVTQELTGQLDEAERTLKWFILSNPGESESRDAQDRVYAIAAKRKLAAAETAAKQQEANSPAARAARKKQEDEELVRSLDGVRFDCPGFENKSGSTERSENWLVIKGSKLNGWSKVIRADPELAAANPQAYSVGAVITWGHDLPITGAVARWEYFDTNYLITSDRIVIVFPDKQGGGRVTCIRR